APWAAMTLALGVPVTAAAAGPGAIGPEGIRMLDGSPAGARFEVVVPVAQLPALAVEGGGTAVRVELEGYSTSDAPGEAALPVRVVTVAVPPLGAVSVTGVGL